MKKIIVNLGYFFKEAKRIIRLNFLSNMLTFVGTVLILFLLATVVTGWSITSRFIQMLEEEAEISAFYNGDINTKEALSLVENISKINGVWNARIVDDSEAYKRMEEILADDSRILGLFEKNPFNAYIEIRIRPDQIDSILKNIQDFQEIDYVRDNREILNQINQIVNGLNILGYLIIAAVGITTIIIISHMIRQGIYDNKDQIKTLRLLGASYMFIGFPFIGVGLLLTLAAGILASVVIVLLINKGYGLIVGTIPFIPLPIQHELMLGVVIVIVGVSIILGIVGSLFGLSSIKEN